MIPLPVPGTTAGSLLAYDAITGSILWQAPAPMAALSQPVLSAGLVFVQGGYDCRSTASVMAAFNVGDGKLIWAAPTTANRYGYSMCGTESSPPVASGVALTTESPQAAGPPFSGTSFVRALDARSGSELWTVQGEEPAAGAGVALVLVPAASGAFQVRGLNPSTGALVWLSSAVTENIAPVVSGRVVMVQGSGCVASCTGPGQASSWVSRLDPATGIELWRVGFGTGSQINRKLMLGDVAVFTFFVETPPSAGQPPSSIPPPVIIGALDPASGTELWRQTFGPDSLIPTLAVPGTVFLAQTRVSSPQRCTARLDALDSKTGSLRWRVDNLKACQLEVAADGQITVLVLTAISGTKMVVLDTATGSELWEKPITTSGRFTLVSANVSGGRVYVAVSGQFIPPPPSD